MNGETPYVEVVFNIPLNRSFSYLRGEETGAMLGKRVAVPFGKRETMGYVIGESKELPSELAPESLKSVIRVVDTEALFDAADVELAKWVAGYYCCGIGEALSAALPQGKRERAASTRGFPEDVSLEPVLALSTEQQRALAAITKALEASETEQTHELLYLFGITGSGKTEVYLQAAEYAIKAGRSVIYLVPEISLTHQTADLIAKRFGPAVAVIHSQMKGSARLSEWRRILRGEARIAVGPRSAIFAPFRDLGLIIIDEEQDGSYKSGNTPRYHARQVAMHRAAQSHIPLLMGSATPSAEAWGLIETGAIQRLDLKRRVAGGTVPEIRPVSLENTEGCLTTELKNEIRATAGMGRQSILFLNRRGFGYFYRCKSCGYQLLCRNCSVSLTYHKSKGQALCHYCGYQESPPRSCPACGSLDAGFAGFGVELIEEEVRRTFPDLRIARVDTDTVDHAGSLEDTLQRFRAGEIDLLLGTQMVAKGLNFPGVRLVGVILADMGLQLPDFRAAERTFSLIVQVAGRAGRFFPDGIVIVQTLRPKDPAIIRACALDVQGFMAAELATRKALGFPPYSRLIRFTIRSRSQNRADRAIARLADIALPLLPPGADALGPAECPIGLLAGNHRRQLLLRGSSMGTLHTAASGIIREYNQARDSQTYLEIDIDPVSLL